MSTESPTTAADGSLRTALHQLHLDLGARMVPFAGWEMPIQYEGVIAEHTWCRESAALFDVSHMATITLTGEDPARSLEQVTPAGITTLGPGRQRYGLLTNEAGGIVDDFIATGSAPGATSMSMVINASRRHADLEFLGQHLPDVDVSENNDIALLALQGPKAAEVLSALGADVADMIFLDQRSMTVADVVMDVSRSGYTGEDGFELAVPIEMAVPVAEAMLADPLTRPAGLGARDTLRLEAGLSLYGNDLDETTSPIEADLRWTIPKRRREAGDFLGASRILTELEHGPPRLRAGLLADGKRPIRQGASLRLADSSNSTVGVVTSGGFGPTLDRPVAMALVEPHATEEGTALIADVRGKDVPCTVAPLPFSPHNYRRKI